MERIICLMLALCQCCLFVDCSSTKGSLREHTGSYLESIKLNFDAGEQAIKDEEYDKAISYFQFVKSKYPFSKYAGLSDLRLADVKFLQKKWLSAASAYELFIRLHPRNEEVPYASFRVAMSYFHATPAEFFLFPKSSSRDQSFVKEALRALDQFILQYPQSSHITEAKEKQALLFSSLAKHNMHVADYYRRRGEYDAAVARLVEVEELYPQTAESGEALYLAAKILSEKLKNPERAIELLTLVVDQKRESVFFERANILLEQLLSKRKK